jgi:dihydroneopterin aldolase
MEARPRALIKSRDGRLQRDHQGYHSTVEASNSFLLEKLVNEILTLILKNPQVQEARVEVDKPLALRYSDSVSVEVSGKR